MLLWIRDAPMIGRDDPSKVLAWIEERITCHIPDQENNPELHILVLGTNCTNAAIIAKGNASVGRRLLPHANLDFPASQVRVQKCTVLKKS